MAASLKTSCFASGLLNDRPLLLLIEGDLRAEDLRQALVNQRPDGPGQAAIPLMPRVRSHNNVWHRGSLQDINNNRLLGPSTGAYDTDKFVLCVVMCAAALAERPS